MGHWLDEAEKRQELKHRRDDFKRVMQYRKERIEKNYGRHGEAFDAFKNTMIDLAQRVNNLPVEEREPFGAITFKKKVNTPQEHSYYLRTSLRKQKFEWRGFMKLFRKAHYKHVRSVFISLSSHDGFIHFELNEHDLKKERLTDQADQEKKKGGDKKERYKGRFMYRYDLSKADDSLARDLLDWLTYRSSREKIAFAKPEFQIR